MPKPAEMTGIATRLAALRRTQLETQAGFARALGVSVNTYIKWEQGSAEPPAWVLLRAHKLYHVDLLWLHSGEGEAFGGEPMFTRIRVTELAENIAADIGEALKDIPEAQTQKLLPRILELSLLRHVRIGSESENLPVRRLQG